MSGAITQTCYGCAGMKTVPRGDVDVRGKGPVMCPDCSGTGRIPDVEATLRAEVARLTTHVEGLIEVNRINLDVAKSQEAAHLSLMQTTTAYYEAEVARLTAELDDANFARSTMIEGCDSLGNRLTAAKAEIARLTAEVGRLKEREAADIMVNDRDLKYSVEYRDESRAAWLAGCKS